MPDEQGVSSVPPSSPGAPGEGLASPAVRRAPLVPAGVVMAAGIAAGRYAPAPAGLWGALTVAALAMALIAFRRRHLHALTVAGVGAGVFFASAMAGGLAYRHVSADDIVLHSDAGPVLATIRGQVASEPDVRPSESAFWMPPRTSFLLSAEGVRSRSGEWRAARGIVRAGVAEPVHDLACGDEVELVGSLRRIRPPGNPGQYDWRSADRLRGIHVRFDVPGADGVTVIRPAGRNPLLAIARKFRALLRRHLAECGDAEDAMLVEALVLGERDPALRRLNRAMVDAGIAHFLSISGQHLGVFLGFVYCLGRVLMLSPRRAAAAVLIVLIAYVLLAAPQAPLLRAAIMAGAFCVAVVSGRGVSVANALAAAAIVLLLADPLQVFTPAFQLSFGIVCGMVALTVPIRRALFGRFLRRRGLMVFRRGARPERFRRWLYYGAADWAIQLACVSLAAYVTAVPLAAYHFGLFSPYAGVLTLVLLPLMTAILVPAYVSLALAGAMPNLAAVLGDLAGAGAGILTGFVGLLRHLPGLSVDLFPVPAWLVALFYVAVALWVLTGRWPRVLPAAALASLALGGAFALTQRPAPAPPAGCVHVLDVQHGSMVLFHAPDGRTWLFDAGTLGEVNAYHDILRPFLRAERLPPPEAVFISHANLDHYSALPDLLVHRPPGMVYLTEFFGRQPGGTPMLADLMRRFSRGGVPVERLRRGQRLSLGERTSVEVLWPPPAAEAPDLDANDSSLVLRIVCGNRRVLVPGDIGPTVEEQLSALPAEDIAGDVLVLPHHGSATPALKGFIRAISPSVLVQSSSFRPDPPELLEAIARRPRYATFLNGWIGLDLSDLAEVQTMRGR